MWGEKYLKKKSQDFFRAIDVPETLYSITDIDEKSEVDAQQVGFTHGEVNKIWHAVEDFYKTGMYPGLSFCLRRKGEIVLNRSIGYARGIHAEEGLDEPVLMTTNTPVCLYSASKAVMAMVVHKLAEEGYVDLLNPVSVYIPEFGQCGKKNISIYQMLAHRGGFPMIDGNVPMDVMFDRNNVLDIIYKTETLCSEGRVQAYHAVTSGFIADELVRVTTGKTIQEYMKEKFSDPMGMKYFTFGLDKKNQHKAAVNYVTGIKNGKLIEGVLSKAFGVSIDTATELSNSKEFMEAIVPSANLYATAEEISRFYQMLIDSGRYKNKEILQPVTVHKATREAGGARLDKGVFLPLRFSAGFMLGGKPVGMYGINTHHAFGHLGFSNIFCWGDPERDIAVSILTTGKPIVGNHLLALPKLMHAISSLCSPCEIMID
jgi:CubicO group peptidase (beta-lactamase class C family)